jgi:hypothetical protein
MSMIRTGLDGDERLLQQPFPTGRDMRTAARYAARAGRRMMRSQSCSLAQDLLAQRAQCVRVEHVHRSAAVERLRTAHLPVSAGIGPDPILPEPATSCGA